jgi:lipopolysaccharide biosynthesis regulator YciM
MHLRARSVSEVVNLKYRCNNKVKTETEEEKDCGQINEISFNVLEVQPIITKGHTNKFQLNDKVGIVMKYPTFELMQSILGKEEGDVVMELIYASIDQVYDEDTVYHMKDNTKEEIVEFIDNLQQKDLENIRNFFDTMPKIEKKLEYKCKKCGYEENITLEGVQSFFA